jgi:23S rRNA (adenine2030-N6)-methyltransferase
MLSYRHGYHAGNFADVLKHLVLVLVLEYLKTKPAPIRYIDTHAGAGSYDLAGEMSRKTGEATTGVRALDLQGLPAAATAFGQIMQPFLARDQYPGSPLIAASLLRSQDELRLYELHSAEFPLLARHFSRDRRVRVFPEDGFDATKSQLPVQAARALVLIDPSYELDADYRDVVDAVREGLRRMSNAIVLVWYPVVEPRHLEPMLKRLATLGGEKSLRAELRLLREPGAPGMKATGMFVINPPWVLAGQLREALAPLSRQLGAKAAIHAGQ